jgi:imidazolonepropionase-like amidohydrolase
MRIEADLLIPGRGKPVADGVVVTDGAMITYAGPRAGAPSTDEPETPIRVPVVMPGMWECHGHLIGLPTFDLDKLLTLPPALAGARGVRDLRAALDAGFTSVREAGGYGVTLARAVTEGSVVGPTIYAAGAILSPTGGHADVHAAPLPWIHDHSQHGGVLRVCDGVPEVLRAVREQLRRNAKVIKICASGGVLSEVDHPIHQQFSEDELRAIVEEAGRAERSVMAHCHGKPGIMAALAAGVRTIEHGTYLDEEAADAMRESGALLVSTRLIVTRALAFGARPGGMPDYALAKLEVIAEQHAAALALAHQRGVRLALGTDIGTSGPGTPLPWGDNAGELTLLVAAGLTPLEAIEAATANAPATLGPQAPRSGVLAEGHDADLIAVAADPTAGIGVLTDPANITHVWKAGDLVKSPAAPARAA